MPGRRYLPPPVIGVSTDPILCLPGLATVTGVLQEATAWYQPADWCGNRLPSLAMDALPPEAAALVRPERVWSRAEVLGRPSPVPAVAGTYAWYFKQLPAAIDTTKCISWVGLTLLYVGISLDLPPGGGHRGYAAMVDGSGLMMACCCSHSMGDR
jgi:hypothetical protein